MLKRVPLIPTLLVLMAVAVMVRLGLWQLDRLHQKEALLTRYAVAETEGTEIAFPFAADGYEAALYHRSRLDCRSEGGDAPMAGRNAGGETGWAHVMTCITPSGERAEVVLGWSRDLALREWDGGTVTGFVAPGANGRVRLVADPPQAGLEASARPDPSDIPNNHLAYAVQWFLFAAVALVIYALALRKRLAAGDGEG